MKAEFVQDLRCPACGRDRVLELRVERSDAREAREGTLRCRACGTEFAVHRGVPELLHEPPEHMLAEAPSAHHTVVCPTVVCCTCESGQVERLVRS